MQNSTSEELTAHLRHAAHEIRQIQQLLAAVVDRVQTTSEEVHLCSDRVKLIDPTIDALHRQIRNLTEEMDRVYALRDNETDSHLRQENAQLKRDIAAVQHALRREMDAHHVHRTESFKSNEELKQRVQSLEQFNELLKAKLNEMKGQYETSIIDNVDLRDTIKSMQNTPAFNVISDTEASSYANRGTSPGLTPFGKTVVETNRGLTVTIESSRDNSPEKASLHHGWIPELPDGAAVPFPEIFPQPQSTSPAPASGGSEQVAIPTPGRPKARAIVKGTQEANESFERMKRSFLSSPLPSFSNVVSIDNNATAISSSFASASGGIPIIRPFAVHPLTPSKGKSKLNPTVDAFTPSNPSNSGGKDSVKSGSMQAASPSKSEYERSATASNDKDEGFVPPHLRRPPKISVKAERVTTTEEPSVEEMMKHQEIGASSAQNDSTKKAEPLQATSLTPRILPHLRHHTKLTQNENAKPSQMQPSSKGKNKENMIEGIELFSRDPALTDMKGNMKENAKAAFTSGAFMKHDPGLQAWLDSQEKASNSASAHDATFMPSETLIEIDPDSPELRNKKTVPLPPGFIPISSKDAPAKTETAAPVEIKASHASSPTSAHEPFNQATKDESTAPEHEVPTKITSEKEKNAAFMAEYNKGLSSISAKYGKDSRKSSVAKEDVEYPIEYTYIPPTPIGTRELGSLLDDLSYGMVMKPRTDANNVEEVKAGQEWKAVRKDGKVFYVL